MSCPQCGCRLVSPSRLGSGRLICCDCGQWMDTPIRANQPLAGVRPRVVAALLLVLGLGAMGLLALRDQLSGSGSDLGGSELGRTEPHSGE